MTGKWDRGGTPGGLVVGPEPVFGGLTVQFFVPEIEAGVAFSTRALGRRPNFAPTPDVHEWDHIAPGVTFQVAQGVPRPT